MSADPILTLAQAGDLFVDAGGPDPIVVQCADGLHVDLPDEPLTIVFLAAGLPGRDGEDGAAAPLEGVAAVDMVSGTPVAVDRASGQLVAADAAFKPKAFVIGLLTADVAAGFVATASPQRLALNDWTAIAGSQQLVPGVPYFLAGGGGLTPTPPASSCVAMVGRAINPTTLLIDPQMPIEL